MSTTSPQGSVLEEEQTEESDSSSSVCHSVCGMCLEEDQWVPPYIALCGADVTVEPLVPYGMSNSPRCPICDLILETMGKCDKGHILR